MKVWKGVVSQAVFVRVKKGRRFESIPSTEEKA
jgi:hypothetical protein